MQMWLKKKIHWKLLNIGSNIIIDGARTTKVRDRSFKIILQKIIRRRGLSLIY